MATAAAKTSHEPCPSNPTCQFCDTKFRSYLPNACCDDCLKTRTFVKKPKTVKSMSISDLTHACLDANWTNFEYTAELERRLALIKLHPTVSLVAIMSLIELFQACQTSWNTIPQVYITELKTRFGIGILEPCRFVIVDQVVQFCVMDGKIKAQTFVLTKTGDAEEINIVEKETVTQSR